MAPFKWCSAAQFSVLEPSYSDLAVAKSNQTYCVFKSFNENGRVKFWPLLFHRLLVGRICREWLFIAIIWNFLKHFNLTVISNWEVWLWNILMNNLVHMYVYDLFIFIEKSRLTGKKKERELDLPSASSLNGWISKNWADSKPGALSGSPTQV